MLLKVCFSPVSLFYIDLIHYIKNYINLIKTPQKTWRGIEKSFLPLQCHITDDFVKTLKNILKFKPLEWKQVVGIYDVCVNPLGELPEAILPPGGLTLAIQQSKAKREKETGLGLWEKLGDSYGQNFSVQHTWKARCPTVCEHSKAGSLQGVTENTKGDKCSQIFDA